MSAACAFIGTWPPLSIRPIRRLAGFHLPLGLGRVLLACDKLAPSSANGDQVMRAEGHRQCTERPPLPRKLRSGGWRSSRGCWGRRGGRGGLMPSASSRERAWRGAAPAELQEPDRIADVEAGGRERPCVKPGRCVAGPTGILRVPIRARVGRPAAGLDAIRARVRANCRIVRAYSPREAGRRGPARGSRFDVELSWASLRAGCPVRRLAVTSGPTIHPFAHDGTRAHKARCRNGIGGGLVGARRRSRCVGLLLSACDLRPVVRRTE
jgi:hypothetical protein